MTALRRYIFPLFAAVAALAIGIALGGGPLQVDDNSAVDLRGENAVLTDKLASAEAAQVFEQSVMTAATSDWLAGHLEGAKVTIVVLPRVDDARVAALQDAVASAGGVTAVTVTVAPDLVDSAQKTYVDSVATSSLQGLADLRGVKAGETYERIGALVARAYVGRSDSSTFDAEADKIDAELQGARLVTLDAAPSFRGNLVVVLAAGDHGIDDDTAATHLIETELVSALANVADGLVTATPPAGAEAGGLIAAVLADPDLADRRVSTLNVITGPAANVAIVYALAAAANGQAGVFGIDGSEVSLPPGMAADTP